MQNMIVAWSRIYYLIIRDHIRQCVKYYYSEIIQGILPTICSHKNILTLIRRGGGTNGHEELDSFFLWNQVRLIQAVN